MSDFRTRVVVALVLCAVIFIVWDLLVPKPPPPEPDAQADVTTQVQGEGATKDAGPDASTVPSTDEGAAPPTADVEIVEHEVRNDDIALMLTNRSPLRGGMITSTQLLGEKFREHATGRDPFGLQGGETLELSFADEATDFRVPRNTAFEVREAGSDHLTLAYVSDEVEIVERFELLDGYEARLRVEVKNRSGSAQSHRLRVRSRIGKSDSRYDVHRGLCQTGDDLEDEDAGDVEDGPIRYTGPILWGGVDSKYFGTYLVPSQPLAECVVGLTDDGRFVYDELVSDVSRLDPGQSKEYLFGVYVGAKELDRLEAFSAVAQPPGGRLEEAIDWGFLGGVSEALGRFLLGLLRWFHALTGNWGVSIILLTIMVKLVTLPLTLKQMSSMKRMKEVQPEIQKIKEKYADDRVKQGQEMQALFARSGVNPLAGCLPMLVQIPIWFALYSMLNSAVELLHVEFLWLPDLTQQDPYYILPLALGAMMVLQNRMMPMTGDEAQAKMMRYMMPAVFTLFMLFLPSGLGVYIFVNVVLSIIQTAIQVGTKTQEAKATP